MKQTIFISSKIGAILLTPNVDGRSIKVVITDLGALS